MKYLISNINIMDGGDVPKINAVIPDDVSEIEKMNILGPLYFNSAKNPISTNSSIYNYDFEYKPDSTVLSIDNNLNLNQTAYIFQDLVQPEPISPINRIIHVNGLYVPYHLGKTHVNKRFFGKIKFLFQYLQIKTNESDPNIREIIMIKKEDDIINLINSLFNISDEDKILIGLSQRLANPIDKFIFINKFYELIDMITWVPPSITISEQDLPTFQNILIVDKGFSKKLPDYIKENNYYEIIKLYMNTQNDYQVKFHSKLYTQLNIEEKNKYLHIISVIDYIYTKLKSIFTNSVIEEPEKINLINLLDLYGGFNGIFLNETWKDSSSNSYSPDILVRKNLESIEKINLKVKPNFFQILYTQTWEIIDLMLVCHKIRNWPIALGIDNSDLKLDMILLLSYFDLRVGSTQIKKGPNLNALPINQVLAYENLFGGMKSTISSEQELGLTEKFLSNEGFGPEVINETPYVNITIGSYSGTNSNINFPACVENTLFQLIKFLFWDESTKSYNLDLMSLPVDNYFRSIMELFIKTGRQSNKVLQQFVTPLINLKNVKYINSDYELNALSTNIVKLLALGLQNSIDEIKIKGKADPDSMFEQNLETINRIIRVNNYELEHEVGDNPNKSLLILKHLGNRVLILTMYHNAHGDVSKGGIEDINLINESIKNFYFYLNCKEFPEITVTYGYIPEYQLINIDTFISSRGTNSPYFNTRNIYWLNFINWLTVLVDKQRIYDITKNNDDTELYMDLVINIIDDIFIAKYTDKQIYIVQNDYDLFSGYLDTVLKFSIDKKQSTYENLEILLKANPYFLTHEIEPNRNIIQSLVTNYFECSDVKSLIYIINLSKTINNNLFFDYYENTEQPIIIFINELLKEYENFNTYKFDDLVRMILALIDTDQNVLKFVRGYDLSNKRLITPISYISKLPLYLVLNEAYFIENLIGYNTGITSEQITQFINLLIDKDRIILDLYSQQTPLFYYLRTILVADRIPSEFDKLDNYFKIPISTLQTNTNIFLKSGTKTRSLICYIMNQMYNLSNSGKLSKKTNDFLIDNNFLIDYFIQNKLLIESTIDGNQPALNIYDNTREICLLSLYVKYMKAVNFNCETFKYLYNKEPLIINPMPISYYIYNSPFELDINIVRLLTRDYNQTNPLTIPINYYKQILYPITELLRNINDFLNISPDIEMDPNETVILSAETSILKNKDKFEKLEKVVNYFNLDNTYLIYKTLSKYKDCLGNSLDLFREINKKITINGLEIEPEKYARLKSLFE